MYKYQYTNSSILISVLFQYSLGLNWPTFYYIKVYFKYKSSNLCVYINVVSLYCNYTKILYYYTT